MNQVIRHTVRAALLAVLLISVSALTPRPGEVTACDSLTPNQKCVATRLMEAFAGDTAQTDYTVGRVPDALEQVGQLQNTLNFQIIGDNGASMEGTPYGALNEMAALFSISAVRTRP